MKLLDALQILNEGCTIRFREREFVLANSEVWEVKKDALEAPVFEDELINGNSWRKGRKAQSVLKGYEL